ncbi:MAG: sigma-54 interaction domain-containing protein [Polyangiales bacterium]
MSSSQPPESPHSRSLVDSARIHESLDRLGSAFDALPEGVLLFDEDGRVDVVNRAARKLLAWEDRSLARHTLASPELAQLAPVLSYDTDVDARVVRLRDRVVSVSTQRVTRGLFVRLVECDATVPSVRYGFGSFLGEDPVIKRAIELARSAARVQANLLITGETGTGKEVLAQSIHGAGAFAAEPFVGINCAAVPRELLEAELFGYERGAFTGARGDGSSGKLELAARGTLLLDEIGEMPIDMQAKLLRVLQERVFMRVGGLRELQLRARVIASTHRDVDVLVREGRFRLDLVHRLRVISIALPPLRARRGDIADLARHFLRSQAQRDGKRLVVLSPWVVETLVEHDWPGNVRELANVMQAEVALAGPRATTLTAFASGFRPSRIGPDPSAGQSSEIVPLERLERQAIERALEQLRGNVSRTAAALGVSRAALYARLRRWGAKLDDER